MNKKRTIATWFNVILGTIHCTREWIGYLRKQRGGGNGPLGNKVDYCQCSSMDKYIMGDFNSY